MSTQKSPELRPLMLALNIGWQIAIPLVALALIGRYVDTVLRTSPLLFLIGIMVAIIFSSWLVIRTVARVIDTTADTPQTVSKNTDKTKS